MAAHPSPLRAEPPPNGDVATAKKSRLWRPLAWCGALALLVPAPARADLTKVECADEDTRGQSLRRDGKLSDARQALSACANPSCPALVRDDCASQLDALDRIQPTIAFRVKDTSGSDLTAVSVTVDGVPLATTLDGKPFALDPGKHAFVFSAPSRAPVSRTLVLTEGEKGRLEHLVLDDAPVSPSGLGAQRMAGLVVGGVGFAGLVVGSVMGVAASSAWSHAASVCGGSTAHCTNVAAGESERGTAVTDASVSTAAFIVGALCVGGGAALFFTGGRRDNPSSSRFVVAPVFGRGEAGGAIVGVF